MVDLFHYGEANKKAEPTNIAGNATYRRIAATAIIVKFFTICIIFCTF